MRELTTQQLFLSPFLPSVSSFVLTLFTEEENLIAEARLKMIAVKKLSRVVTAVLGSVICSGFLRLFFPSLGKAELQSGKFQQHITPKIPSLAIMGSTHTCGLATQGCFFQA